jgi:hypothetical protein
MSQTYQGRTLILASSVPSQLGRFGYLIDETEPSVITMGGMPNMAYSRSAIVFALAK